MRFQILILAGALISCATAGRPDDRFVVMVSDHPERELFEVTLTSHSPRQLCLSPEFWPNSHGWMPAAPQTATVTIGEANFPIDGNYNAGYCPGNDCAVRVRPHSSISGIILYQRFGIPREQANSSKVLHFSPQAFTC
jgi:hypothetical protein